MTDALVIEESSTLSLDMLPVRVSPDNPRSVPRRSPSQQSRAFFSSHMNLGRDTCVYERATEDQPTPANGAERAWFPVSRPFIASAVWYTNDQIQLHGPPSASPTPNATR